MAGGILSIGIGKASTIARAAAPTPIHAACSERAPKVRARIVDRTGSALRKTVMRHPGFAYQQIVLLI
jgi:hypothetical protein